MESPVEVHGHTVVGVEVDPETRCAHYDAPEDVVALKLGCCERYVACFRCHEAVTDHGAEPWPASRFDEAAVLCGVCGTELSVETYVGSDSCPDCGTRFNPNCAAHYDRYFEGGGPSTRLG
jgi:uncharacterized CHY-type Zn-finger protein